MARPFPLSYSDHPVLPPRLLLSLGLCLSFLSPVFSQTAPDQSAPIPLQAVVVSATRTPESLDDVPGSVAVFDSVTIDQNNVNNLGELVRNEPGVTAPFTPAGTGPAGFGGSGFMDFNIRGIDGNRVLIEADGIRQPDQFTFGGAYAIGRDYFELEDYKAVEILKGSASALYGSDAVGGVVSFATKDPSDYLGLLHPNYYAAFKEAFDGSNDSLEENGTLALRTGAVDWLFVYTRRDGSNIDPAGDSLANPQNFSSDGLLAKMVVNWDAENKTTFTGEFFQQTTDTGLKSSLGIDTPLSTFITNETLHDYLESYRFSLQHEYQNRDTQAFLQDFKAQIYFQNSLTLEDPSRDEIQLASPVAFYPAGPVAEYWQYQYQETIVGLNLQADTFFQLGFTQHQFTAGAEIDRQFLERNRNGTAYSVSGASNQLDGDTFPAQDMPDTSIIQAGVFAQDQIRFFNRNLVTLIPGARLDYYGETPDGDPLFLRASGGRAPVGYYKWSISPKLALVIKPTPELTFYAQYNRGFKNPTPEDLNASVYHPEFGYESVANPNLKSETSNAFEIGVRGNYPIVHFSIAGFYTLYDNFINPFQNKGIDPATGLEVFESVNIGRVDIYGIETKLEFPFAYYSESLRGWSALFTIAWTEGVNRETNAPINTVQPLTIGEGLSYKDPSGRFGISLNGQWVARQTRVDYLSDPQQFVPPAFFRLDLQAYFNLTSRVSLSAGLYNLTNTKYWVWNDVIGFSNNPASTNYQADLGRFAQPGLYGAASLTIRF